MSAKVDLTSYVKDKMIEYGKYTLQDRAIPELKDGLKPVHRRLLWTAYCDGYTSDKTTKKCAKIVGSTLGQFSPNGDQPVYGALVNLVNNPNALFIGQGSFGCSATDDPPSSMRYTEAKLSPLSEKYLLDKDYLAVTPMVPNYDGTLQEPVYLPAKLPIILTQGIEGIATGAATNIPSFTLESVKQLALESIKRGSCTAEMCNELLEFYFSEGGKVYSSDAVTLNFFKTGKAKLFVAPVFVSAKHAVIMTSYSPRLKLDSAIEAGLKVDGVTDVENASGFVDGKYQVRIVFSIKKMLNDNDVRKIRVKLIKAIGGTIPYSIMVTDRSDSGKNTDTVFRYTNIPEIVNDWMTWRLQFEVKVVKRLVELEESKRQKLNWLIWAIDHLQLIFKALKSDNPDKYLIVNGKIEPEHAKYILDQQTRRLSKLSGEELRNKVQECTKTIEKYETDILTKKSVAKRVYNDLKKL